MPTRGRRRGRSSATGSGEGNYGMGSKIAGVAKKGIEGYLKGTQMLADKISEKLPTAKRGMVSSRRGNAGRRGGRGRTGGGPRNTD